ncbi:MAG: GTP cyclohydrolase I FolE2 [Candidatus Lokiarchaeota archaeon]|nr:GTP cyclohydrolase I FolE2 [Candidatus Lokiarchaeota archaeon]
MDLQDSGSAIDIAIDKVGIVELEKKVEIVQENKKYSFYPKISALIDLPAQQRGIHMSRTSETIEEVINEVIYKPTPTIELVGDRIIKKLLERHPYTSKAEVKLKGKIIVQVRENNTRNIQKSYEIISFVKAKRPSSGEIEYTYFIGASAVGMTVCPCAKEMSQEYAAEIIKTRKDIHVTEEDLNKLINILPFSSHNQRSNGTIIVQIKELTGQKLDVLDIIDVIEESMSGKIQSVLKRPEEAELVRSAHLKPLFSEDVIREMAKNFIIGNFPNLEDDYEIEFKIESFESIHPHNVYAELKTTIGDLKKKLKLGNSIPKIS